MSVDGTASMGPDETARAFVDAVIWGDHKLVWDLLGIEGRTTVLRIAGDRGMDDALVARLRDGTAADAERDEFLADLVNGLRADLAGNDLDALEYELDTAPHEPGRARVVVHSPLPPALGGTLPAASVELSSEAGEWRVERLVPLTSQ
ncbi:MAG TPA: hypothetical protein VHG90_14835 [Acidimicrobiales bacterium]|nr:hypothetical protein [Acidimicrobiales bacterium]